MSFHRLFKSFQARKSHLFQTFQAITPFQHNSDPPTRQKPQLTNHILIHFLIHTQHSNRISSHSIKPSRDHHKFRCKLQSNRHHNPIKGLNIISISNHTFSITFSIPSNINTKPFSSRSPSKRMTSFRIKRVKSPIIISMNRNIKHPVILLKNLLCSITMMDISVENKNFSCSRIKGFFYSHSDVV